MIVWLLYRIKSPIKRSWTSIDLPVYCVISFLQILQNGVITSIMMAPAHMVAGATSWAVYTHFAASVPQMGLSELAGGMSICAVAALLPDIDHPTSTLGQKIYPVSKFISSVFGHRGITHSLIAFFGMMYLLTSIAPEQEHGVLITIVAVGYLSHLVGDVITPAGLPLLYPIRYRFTTPITIEAGGVGECVVVVLYGLFALALYTQWHLLVWHGLMQWLH